MESRYQFLERVREQLNNIEPNVLAYQEDEFWMIRSAYEYVDHYATRKQLWNTMIALPLARGLHDGTHRKSSVLKDGEMYRLPYMIHPLQVCRLLIDLQVPLTHEEEDVMLAACLCHDVIEDIPLPEHGREMVTLFGLSEAVYDTVKAVSKRKGFTEEEERAFFKNIGDHKLALLVKLSDRGNNVEDLYNMSLWKIHEYAGETRKYFIPMCEEAKDKFPEINSSLEMLENKMITLIKAAEILADRYSEQEKELQEKLQQLKLENDRLRKQWQKLWNR